MSIRQDVAAEVRAAVARAQVSQVALATASGRSQTYWSKRLTGRAPLTVDDLAVVAKLTGVSVSRLLDEAVA